MKKPAFDPCAHWAELLATPTGELEPQEYLSLQKHLQSCPTCSSAHANYERVKGLLRDLPKTSSVPAFTSELPERLRQLWRETASKRQNRAPAPSWGPQEEWSRETCRAYERVSRQNKKTTHTQGGE